MSHVPDMPEMDRACDDVDGFFGVGATHEALEAATRDEKSVMSRWVLARQLAFDVARDLLALDDRNRRPRDFVIRNAIDQAAIDLVHAHTAHMAGGSALVLASWNQRLLTLLELADAIELWPKGRALDYSLRVNKALVLVLPRYAQKP